MILVGSILVMGITFYMAGIYGSTSLALLGYIELTFVILANLYAHVTGFFVKVEFSIPVGVADPGDTVSICLESHTKLGLPMGKIAARIQMVEPGKKGKKNLWIQADEHLTFTGEAPGTYEFTLKKIRIYDPSGLFYAVRKEHKREILKIFPAYYMGPVEITEPTRNFMGDADIYDDFRPGHDSSELFDVREYQPGDRMQRVHWKLSAKAEELMVKEFGYPKACPVTILAIPPESGEVSDFLELVVSLSFSILCANCCHYVCWYQNGRQDLVRFRIDDTESFYLFLNRFMEEKLVKAEGMETLYQQKYRSEPKLHLLTVEGDLTVKRGDYVIGKGKRGQIRRFVEQTELVL